MKLLKGCLNLIFCGLTLGSCYTAELVQGPDGSWYETGRQELYPQWEVLRGKKQLKFPEDLQIQVIDYYEKRGIWPYSIEGFKDESDINREVLNRIYELGFQDLLFIQQDNALLIYFKFAKRIKIKLDAVEDGYVKTNLIPGVWKFYLSENNLVKAEQKLYVDY